MNITTALRWPGRMLILIALLFICAGSVVSATDAPSPAPGKEAGSPAPLPETSLVPASVTFDGEPLFAIKTQLFSVTPENRARIISERLKTLADDPSFNPERMKVVEDDAAATILSGDYFIMAVTAQDAAVEGKSRRQLAEQYLVAIRNATLQHRKAVSPEQLLRSGLYAVGATVILIILVGAFTWLFRRLLRLLEARLTGCGFRLRSFELVNEKHVRAMISAVVNVVRVLIFVVLLVSYLQVVLNLFPWTRGFAHRTLELILDPLLTIGAAIARYIPNLFFIAVLVVLTHYLLRFIRFIFTEIDRGVFTIPGFYRDWAWPTFNIVRLLVLAFVVVVAFPYIPGSESPAFKGISLFVGVLFSLGSTSAIGNIVSGTILTYMRPFVVGDRVKIADTVGDVVEKSLLVTRIKTIKNVEITIPNSLILGTHIVNYSMLAQKHGLIIHTTVTIGYDTPWETVQDLLIAAARSTTHILPEPPPFVFQTALNDFYVSYQINAATDQPNLMDDISSELHKNIQRAFNGAGVEIMSPHYSQIRDGNTVTIPEAYRPAGYTPPSFRINRAPTEP